MYRGNIWNTVSNISVWGIWIYIIIYFFFKQYLNEDLVIYLKLFGYLVVFIFLLSKFIIFIKK
jgi:hypothetical protein